LIYLVFKGDTFAGHTNNKRTLKRFIKERKSKYRVEEIPDRLLTDELKNEIDDFLLKELYEYEHFDRVLTELEVMHASMVVNQRLVELVNTTSKVNKKVKYIRFTDSEKAIVDKFIHFIKLMEEDLMGPETCAFPADYFDMHSIIDVLISKR
jgi:hypothetical protein